MASLFHVRKRTLLAVAGAVWLAAGFNVARLGIISYQRLPSITLMYILLSPSLFRSRLCAPRGAA